MSGHLFIVRGDLTRLACDAWLMPTSYGLQVERYWLQPEPAGFAEAMGQLREALPPSWYTGDQRVLRAPAWPEDRSQPWLVNVLGHSFRELDRVVRMFVKAVLEENNPPRNERERLLLALPVISTGKGGGAKVKGQVIAALVRELMQIVKDCNVDLVLVTHTAAALAAAQKARKDGGYAWSDLSEANIAKAQALAEVGRSRGLALFLGAGVSVSAGLPSWNGLLRQLAETIDINTESELEEFSHLDVLDRGSVLERRFKKCGKDLRLAIAEIFERTRDHSLLHSLLAGLPAAEVITQNYDRLFEFAVEGAGGPLAVLPYTPGPSHTRWLLKMHGCISVPEDIVIQREDYLRYTERRAALTGIVQATLLTRSMLFVGFSLSDGNFHRAMDDVRRALSGQQGGQSMGTALFLTRSDLIAELWHSELDIVHFQEDTEVEKAPAARRLEVFMDCLLAYSGSNTDHLLDPTFAHLLTPGENDIKEALMALGAKLAPMKGRQVEAWTKVEELLRSMGWSGSKGGTS